VEYSSREVKPSGLLAQDLLRAHSVFLLHHGGSLGASLGARDGRARLTRRLRRYWDLFLSSWNVMLHANPARDAFGGIRIAACGELGVGVGEEERGSGEREVLEGFVGRVEGLVDLVVSKFGEGEVDDDGKQKGGGGGGSEGGQWLGTGNEPGGEDGAVFLGVGALSRQSLRDVTYWMEDLYVWGENAYGVIGRSATTEHAKRKEDARKPSPPPAPRPPQMPPTTQSQLPPSTSQVPEFGPPPPLIGPRPIAKPSSAGANQAQKSNEAGSEGGGVDKFVSYLKMGYGTYWTLGTSPSHDAAAAAADDAGSKSTISQRDESEGHYLIGLMGDVDEDGSGTDTEDSHFPRTHLRTLTVELAEDLIDLKTTEDLKSGPAELERRRVDGQGNLLQGGDRASSNQGGKKAKLQVVVYVNAPFIFTFLFEPGTQSLSSDALYRSLHYQLAPLRKPLVSSTAYRPGRPDVGSPAAQIYDLVWDPKALTVHSTIPNIPDPTPNNTTQAAAADARQVWSRVDALNTHTQILNMFAATREEDHHLSELERTAKTSRGWWIVWNRVVERETTTTRAPPSRPSSSAESSERRASDADSFDEGEARELPRGIVNTSKEILLVRRAGDHSSSSGGGMRAVSGSYGSGGGGGGWTDGASRLAQGIGVDTRKYIEGLLSLNR